MFTAGVHICHSSKLEQIHLMDSSVLSKTHQNKDLLEEIFSWVCLYSESVKLQSQHQQLANRNINNVHGPLQRQRQTRASK